MFSFVETDECGVCGDPVDCCLGHGEFNGFTSLDFLTAVCDVTIISYRDCHNEIIMTMEGINEILADDVEQWCVFGSYSVDAMSDEAARTVAVSVRERAEHADAVKRMAAGKTFRIAEIIQDCQTLMSRATAEEREALTALAYWAWEKIETEKELICSGCGLGTCYVFDFSGIEMSREDSCMCGMPVVVREND